MIDKVVITCQIVAEFVGTSPFNGLQMWRRDDIQCQMEGAEVARIGSQVQSELDRKIEEILEKMKEPK